jgi:SAM-dependent methyltransferase
MALTVTTESDLDALRRAAHAYAIISAWSHAGLFDLLAEKGPLRPREMDADQRAIEITAPILAHLGLLTGDGSQWALSQAARQLQAAGSLLLGSAETNLGDLSRLDQIMQQGGPAPGPDGKPQLTTIGVVEEDTESAHKFMAFLHRRSNRSAEEVSHWLEQRLQPGAKILDLGGGHGKYGNTLADRGFQVTLFDLPVCIQYAKQHYADRLNYIAGNFMEDELGGPYDAVLISNIIHGLGLDENTRLLGHIKKALRPCGTLAIKDMFLDDSMIGPETAVFFGLTMLLYTQNGRSYSVSEMDALCQETGFSPVEHIRVPDEGFSLLFANAP